MESGACAVGVGLLQPQTGRPVTKQALHRAGSDNDDSNGHCHKEYCQRDNSTDTREFSEYQRTKTRSCLVSRCARVFAGGAAFYSLRIFPVRRQSWGILGGL